MTATVPSQGFSNSLTKYYYDTDYQLTRADYPNVAPFNSEIDSWSYDAIGNRLTNTVNGSTPNYSYYKNGGNTNNGQRLQSDGTNTYTYDNNGNTITKSGPAGNFTYTWNFLNQLTGISSPGLSATYKYDFLGRLATKTVNGVTTTYFYNGADLIAESGGANASYVFGPGIDHPLAQNRSGAISYYNADGLGSIQGLNDSAGAIQNGYVYDAWGVLKGQTGSIFQLIRLHRS